jgi:hypothetical protein
MRGVVVPLVLPSLDAFARQEQMRTDEVESLVRALAKSETLRKDWMCCGQRFIYRLGREGGRWARETWEITDESAPRWLELPVPDFPEVELFGLLPTLAHLCGEVAVSLAGKPRLVEDNPEHPSDEELAELLGHVAVTAFQEARHLAYLLELIPNDASQRDPGSALTTSLVKLANQLVSHRPPAAKEFANLWKDFFRRLPETAFVRLPVESAKANPEIARILLDSESPVATLWQDFRDAAGSGSIPWAALLPMLENLGKLTLGDESAILQRAAVAVRLLDACEERPSCWTEQIERLSVFAAWEPQEKAHAINISQLQVAKSRGLLFTAGQEWERDLSKAAPSLKPLLVERKAADILELQATPCGAADCVRLLQTKPHLAEDFSSRQPLFERLLKDAMPNNADAWSAMRCLLHGNLSAWEQTNRLFRDISEHAVFVRLLKQALVVAGQSWRLIPSSVAAQLGLNDDREQRLNLSAPSAKNVEALLKEVGPERIDCSDLSREDCALLLRQFDDVELLRALNIHDTLGECRVRIDKQTYVDDGCFKALPPEFDQLVTRIRPNHGYARFTAPELVSDLGWEAVIRVALNEHQPEAYCQTILTAVGMLGTLRAELKDVVLESPWLKMTDRTAIAPSVLLHLPGAEAELGRLPSEVLCGRVPLQHLDHSVREHDRFETFKHTVLPSVGDALKVVADLLKPHHATYSTGLSSEWSSEQINDWVQTLGAADGELAEQLAVAPLVKALYGEQRVREYLPAFLQVLDGKLNTNVYAVVLKHLIAGHNVGTGETRPVFERVFYRYLKAISDAGAQCALEVLNTEGVMLLNERGRWKLPRELAFKTNGIVPEEILHRSHADVLGALEQPANAPLPGRADDASGDEAFAQALADTTERFRRYFARWTEFVSQEVVGAFLCILGDAGGIRDLAQERLGQRSVEGTRSEIAALAPVPTTPLLMQAISSFQFACVVHEGQTVRIPSVLGETFAAHLGGDRESIFLGSGVRAFPLAGNWNRRFLHLLSFNLDAPDLNPSRLADLLRASSEAILSYVFSQTGIDLRPLWEKLCAPSQLHIRIAQNLIVDAALAFLRQIGAQQNADVRCVLNNWDEARRQVAEAEENGRSVPPTAHGLLQTAKQQLRALLATNSLTQAEMLAGVRRKIEEFQYSGSSVPFEVWQNADDAVAELERLGLGAERATDLGFVVIHSSDTLAFAHWGRPINEFQGSAGINLRSAGFDRDLEKMLVQAISDKGDAAQQGGSALTGKFGLGFKSVFLVSDTPEVLSASVDFVIRGGIYPVRLEDEKRNELSSSLQSVAPNDARRGTVIRLPLRADGQTNADELLGLFRELAPLLVVFSHRLKRLRFLEESGLRRELQWQPKSLLGGQCEFGTLSEPLERATAALTLISASETGGDRLTFLLGLSQDGFAPLPGQVPVFWVTAPTRATPGYGFAVNGPFEPDVGRVQLALKSDKNRQFAKVLSEAVSTRLAALWSLAQVDWETFQRELDLGSDVSPCSVWESLWHLLGVHFSEKCRKDDTSVVASLARCILWESDATGMRHFYAACAALPTGLWGEHRTLTSLRKIRFVAAGALDRETVFQAVSNWQGFKSRVAVGSICSGTNVDLVLNRLGASVKDSEPIHLATAVEWELGTGKRSDAELAAHLGQLITPEFMAGLEKGQPGEREETEHKRLVELLRDASFQSADATWHKAKELVVVVPAATVENDEIMRAAFAPREFQLHPAYTGPALQFFLASRQRLEVGVERMVEWVLKAGEQAVQIAALRYMLKGALQNELADALRKGKVDGNWLWQLKAQAWFQATFSEEDQHQLFAYVLRLFDEELRERSTAPPPETAEQPPLHIWTVEELWKWWESVGKPTADYTLEGEPNWPLFHGGPVRDEGERQRLLKEQLLSPASPKGKALWYRLFGYACLVSAGRHTSELRRFWTERLNPKRFWERTNNGDFSEETREIFEQAVTAQFSEAAYYWRRVFYDLRKVHRMVCVNDFPSDLIRLVEEGHGEHLYDFLRYGRLPGPDQQRWVGTFGQSADTPLFFIIRELFRLKVITDESVRPLAFYVCRPVLRALGKIGWIEDSEGSFSGEDWITELKEDPASGRELLPYFDIPLLHMGITYRGDRMPTPPL